MLTVGGGVNNKSRPLVCCWPSLCGRLWLITTDHFNVKFQRKLWTVDCRLPQFWNDFCSGRWSSIKFVCALYNLFLLNNSQFHSSQFDYPIPDRSDSASFNRSLSKVQQMVNDRKKEFELLQKQSPTVKHKPIIIVVIPTERDSETFYGM